MLEVLIVNCARCSETHTMNFEKFSLNPIDDYPYWGMCPVVHEPVLLKSVTGVGTERITSSTPGVFVHTTER